ncbi:MAG: hypothetical protein ABSC30_16265 [Acidimicrobiales bacterium]|jgi:hypothetical protein
MTSRDLDNQQRRTLEQISGHPLPKNLKWPAVVALLQAMGELIEESKDRYRATVNGRTEVFHVQLHKDIAPDVVVRLRHFLTEGSD